MEHERIIKQGSGIIVDMSRYGPCQKGGGRLCHPEVCSSCAVKTASTVVDSASPEFVYAAVIGIEGDVYNENWDYWPWEESLMAKKASGHCAGQPAYRTWIGKPMAVNHICKSPSDHYGRIVDATPDPKYKYIRMLTATDRKKDPDLARGIEMGYIDTVSMGCRVARSVCSYCGNEASTPDEYCEDVRFKKGRMLPRRDGMTHFAQSQTGNAIRVGEICYDVDGAELSWVNRPAFPNCKTFDLLKLSGKLAGLGASLTESNDPELVTAGRLFIKAAASETTLSDNQCAAIHRVLEVLNHKLS